MTAASIKEKCPLYTEDNMNINKNFLNLEQSYLFATISRKVAEFKEKNPDKELYRLDIGDVTLPLTPAVIEGLHKATDEMSKKETFKGYGDYQGYPFLQKAVCRYYKNKGISLDENEVFISEGSKSDIGNILDIFGSDNNVVIPDPVYPVYVDTNVMAGRHVSFIEGNNENGFLPLPNENMKADIIYLCSPNNPTGAVYNKEQLKMWVDFANKNEAVILFDSAYEVFIQEKELPTSIFEIEGAKECAIEFCSLSKTAGFTGTRCSYTIVPNALKRDDTGLNKLWLRRQSTKYNGVSYIIQKGAEAVFSDEGLAQINANISYYMENTKTIGDALNELGIWFTGGKNSPYIWLKCPNNLSSWGLFDMLLNKANVVGTPGAGFGKAGEGYFRLNAFGEHEDVIRAVGRLKEVFA